MISCSHWGLFDIGQSNDWYPFYDKTQARWFLRFRNPQFAGIWFPE